MHVIFSSSRSKWYPVFFHEGLMLTDTRGYETKLKALHAMQGRVEETVEEISKRTIHLVITTSTVHGVQTPQRNLTQKDLQEVVGPIKAWELEITKLSHLLTQDVTPRRRMELELLLENAHTQLRLAKDNAKAARRAERELKLTTKLNQEAYRKKKQALAKRRAAYAAKKGA